ncbi:hypothetical protein AWH61_08120 [Alteromonas sp. W12]|nr:hypothetical protein AWH61_08120 [Alteromonas sp. W12]
MYLPELRFTAMIFGSSIGNAVNSIILLADSEFRTEPYHLFIGILGLFAVLTTNSPRVEKDQVSQLVRSLTQDQLEVLIK